MSNRKMAQNSLARTLAASLTLALGLVISSAQATNIAVDDWHLTTDAFGGLKQSHIAENVFFAVSQTTVWDPNANYEMPTGFRWASSVEYGNIVSGLPWISTHTYYNQGGWSGYWWEGQVRYTFKFSDTLATGIAKHAGNYDNHHGYTYYNSYYNNYHAGFVLIRQTDVPEPGMLALFGLGLAGIGFNRRRRMT